ncbi:lysozyme-like domain-containing protein [Gymnopilus junonius]|uniref:Lysozyme-like domain-containing protein n=1 Tax=Gymnopilus junonius TaxID=109634 RepID=A0A9P5TQD4_GYMJU|nr:lysozyme-like domain-containing protein [Gymnopilus junonius]
MRFLASVLALLFTLLSVGAAFPHENLAFSTRHSSLARRVTNLETRASAKRCPNRSSKKTATTPSTNKPVKLASNITSTLHPTSHPTSQASHPNAAASNIASSVGLITVKSSTCGPSGATKQVTKLSGPNGNINWLNCGFEGAGWTPPLIRMQDVITQPLSSALKSPSSPFKACSPYISIFEKYGNQHGIPAIIFASFAMQESSCNPNTVGGAGEQGLMQITKEKCAGAPNGNCKDPDFNIATAAKYFANSLAGNNGNVLLTVGEYNGWYLGLTEAKAFAAAFTNCCRCQNNGDYLHQFFNGWCQNINPYDANIGKYFNLNKCQPA